VDITTIITPARPHVLITTTLITPAEAANLVLVLAKPALIKPNVSPARKAFGMVAIVSTAAPQAILAIPLTSFVHSVDPLA
jgi:hypothetical protein